MRNRGRAFAIGAALLLMTVTVAVAGFSLIQASNNTVPAGGYLLDDTPAFLLDDSNGKVLAR